MSFAGYILNITPVKESTLEEFLTEAFTELSALLYDDNLPGGREEANATVEGLLEYNRGVTSVIVLKPNTPIMVSFLKNSAGMFECIWVPGYEYDYDSKTYMQNPPKKTILAGACVDCHYEYFDTPS
jgi:uncharacterized protein YodC (DUF2158 family)